MNIADIDFLIRQFEKISDSQNYELPSDFAERVRYLPKGLTPFYGKFSFTRFPYFKEIVNLFHPLDPTREIVLEKGNQLGATTGVLETIILYNIMVDPKSQMFVTADAWLMKTGVNARIEPMINLAGARNLIFSQSPKAKGSQNTGDTANAKEYPGGYLHFYGSKNPDKFRSTSYQDALADEIDAYKSKMKDEGDVLDLVRNRTDDFSKKEKYYGQVPRL
jgi:phage terminase large subunit GpA-like protein